MFNVLQRYAVYNKEVNKFQCTVCNKQSARKDNLFKHIESVHFPDSFTYECTFCHETFSTRNKKENHLARFHKDRSSYASLIWCSFTLLFVFENIRRSNKEDFMLTSHLMCNRMYLSLSIYPSLSLSLSIYLSPFSGSNHPTTIHRISIMELAILLSSLSLSLPFSLSFSLSLFLHINFHASNDAISFSF